MVITQMSPKLLYESDQFKTCDGRGCNQKAIKSLRIKYVKKIGSFCEKCAGDLLECRLTEDAGDSFSSIEVA